MGHLDSIYGVLQLAKVDSVPVVEALLPHRMLGRTISAMVLTTVLFGTAWAALHLLLAAPSTLLHGSM